MFVIKNAGRYVAEPGSVSSFTLSLEYARTFPTREAAEREKCGNETIVEVSSILRGR
jgi:hypothetical protein